MPEEKLTRKERKEALITAALNRLDTPWKYQEFVCPCCSGIASVIDREEIIKADEGWSGYRQKAESEMRFCASG